MSEDYSIADSKQTDFGFGVDAQENAGGAWSLTHLAHQASPHDLVMDEISHAGSQQVYQYFIVTNIKTQGAQLV